MTRARVVVIDDDVHLVDAVRRVLVPTYEVMVFTQPRDALAWFQSGESSDVILCDLTMPDLTGMELFEEVIRGRPELRSLFLFFSGSTAMTGAQRFLSRTTNVVLAKPCGVGDLMTAVRTVIERKT
jgi:DNA-binding NtrC family response regulator